MKSPSIRQVLVAPLLLLLTALPAAAEVTFDVRHAAGGLHRTGGLVPFHVWLENSGSEDLELVLEGTWQGAERAVRDVELAAGSRKEMTFYLGPAGFVQDFEVRLWRGEEVLHETLVSSKPVGLGEVAVGLFGNHPLGWNSLRRDRRYEGSVGQLEIGLVPDFGAGLRAYDLLIWTRPEPRRLRPEQILAIERWIAGGGHLVLAASEGAPGEPVAPWTEVETAEILSVTELPSLAAVAARAGSPGPWAEPLAVARFDEGHGEVLLREAWGPAAVIEPRGHGSVVVLGFDPSDPRLAGWPGLEGLWLELLERGRISRTQEGRRRFQRFGSLDLRSRAAAVVSTDPSASPPPLKTLLIVLGLYLLAIGPGEYLLLRRWRRLTWTWITFPLWVTLFSGVAYATAVATRGEVLSSRHLLLRDVFPGRLVAEELHGSLWAPRSGVFRLAPRWPRALPFWHGAASDEMTYNLYAGGVSGARRSPAVPPRSPSLFGSPGQPVFGQVLLQQGRAGIHSRLPRWSFLVGSFQRERRLDGEAVDFGMEWNDKLAEIRLAPRLGKDLDGAVLLAAPRGEPLRFDLGPLRNGEASSWKLAGEIFDRQSIVQATVIWQYQDTFRGWIQDLEVATLRSLLDRWWPDAERRVSGSYMDQQVKLSGDPHPEHDWSDFVSGGGVVLIAWAADREPRFEAGDAEVAADGWMVYRVALQPDPVSTGGVL